MSNQVEGYSSEYSHINFLDDVDFLSYAHFCHKRRIKSRYQARWKNDALNMYESLWFSGLGAGLSP
jgi:hypothetical protein